jgi:hypothetical protein
MSATSELLVADGEGELVPVFGEVHVPREYVITRDGKDFILNDGLITGLHQLSGGFFEVETRLEQLPTEANGMLAVCSARVTVMAPDGERPLRVATGIGDASPGSVSRMIQVHLVRMAETRAVNRALRVLLNVGAVSFEELGPAEPTGRGAEPEPPDRITIEGQTYERPQVVATYKRRLKEAQEAGVAVASNDLLPEDAPLPLLVGTSQSLKRRVEARK